MLTIRTDLAAEAHALWQESAGETTALPGVRAREGELEGFPLTWVEVLDEEGERALGKPRGRYATLDVSALWRREPEAAVRAARAAAALLEPLLPEEGTVLVAGLGNPAMTPDALGPLTLEHLLITRHLGEVLPDFRPAAEWVRGVTERLEPAAVVVVDALASRGLDRLCSAVQVADTGLIPGSGVGNHRMALTRETLGVPVLSVGVPTVVDAETIARDLLSEAGAADLDPQVLGGRGRRLFVTPDSIDARVRELGKVLGYGLDLALQPGLTVEDLEALLS